MTLEAKKAIVPYKAYKVYGQFGLFWPLRPFQGIELRKLKKNALYNTFLYIGIGIGIGRY